MTKGLFLILFLTLGVSAQDKWMAVDTFPLTETSVWAVDLVGNLYLSDMDVLSKYDTSGQKSFSQSFKALGRIADIQAINTMKLLLFSAEQQSFALVDNTLSAANTSYELSDLGFGYVSLMAASAQPNKLWVYDQLNSKLVLLDYGRSGQQQELLNIRGILGASEIKLMFERDQKLYLQDGQHKVYVLDLYGSLLHLVDDIHGPLMHGEKDKLYWNHAEEGLLELDIATGEKRKIAMPLQPIEKWEGTVQILYLQKGTSLFKFKGNF